MKKITRWFALGAFVAVSAMAHAQVQTLSVQINSSSDDAEERGLNATSDTGTMDLTSSDIELVQDGSDGDQFIGLRFANITIPQGAIISNAYIQFTVDEDDDSSGAVIFKVEDVDNGSTFTSTAFDISSRTTGTDSVVWSNIPVWNTVGASGADQATPDLSVLVQSMVNRAGWVSGNAINFIITGTGERVAESYDGSSSTAAILNIEYTTAVQATFTIASGDDDAEEDVANGGMDLSSSDIELTADGSSVQLVGLRYTGVNIPKGSVILDAYVQFTVDESTSSGVTNVLIGAENSGNAPLITGTSGDLSGRNFTLGDTVIWNVPGWPTVGDAGADQRTPNISGAIQNVVDHANWVSGNAMLLAMVDPAVLSFPGYSGNTGKRTGESYNGSQADAPKLVVTYIPPATFQDGVFPVSVGSSWKFGDSGADLSTSNWTDLAYNDSSWAFGDAILGYGNGNAITTLDFGTDPNNKNTTYYLRHTFNVADSSIYDSLVFDVMRDDGVIVYVNGTEAFRQNMPNGTVGYNTFASATVGGVDETTYFRTTTTNLLKNGRNVIAVELHQASASSSDLSFDMGVGFTLPPLQPATYPLSKNSKWHYLDNGSSLDSVAWKDTTFYDDAWAQGAGPLGYGDQMATTISYGSDPNNKHVTYYFRRDINIDLNNLPDSVQLGIRRDDGAIVYINGAEVYRTNMPAGNVDYLTLAPTTVSGSDETTYYTTLLPKSVFVTGRNSIAVEIHNRDVFSSDLGFDMYIDDAPVVNPPALGCANGNGNHIACFTSIAPTAQTSHWLFPSETHAFQMIFKQGETYTKGGGTVPGNHDFTAFVGLNGSSREGHLSVNHENTPGGVSIVDLHFNDTTNLWVVDTTQAVDFYNNDLITTTRNCSGGITPWGTVITCEETGNSGDANNDGYTDVGWAVELDPITAKVIDHNNDGVQDKLWAVGNISHENVCVKSDSITLFTGEDGGSSAVYKFVADNAGDLTAGTLYALKLDLPLLGGEPLGTTATWVQVPNSTQTERNNTRNLAIALGATNFNGVEDVEIGTIEGKVYFTSKGNGRVYRFTDGATVSNFETFVGGTSYVLNTAQGVFTEAWGSGNDNLTFDDQGNLWVLQDGGRNYVWVVRPDHSQSAPKVELFASTPAGAEPCGLTFSNDYRYGFISVQHPSSSNTLQVDASGDSVAFDASATLVFSRDQYLGAQAPVAGFMADTNEVEVGNSVHYTDTSSWNPTMRSWIFNGGTPSVSSNPTETVVYNNVGLFTTELRVSNSVGADTAVYVNYIEVVPTFGVVENLPAGAVTVYPNPTSGKISIKLNADAAGSVDVELYSLTGQKLAELGEYTSNGNDILEFNVNDFAGAEQTLILKVQANGKNSIHKIHLLK